MARKAVLLDTSFFLRFLNDSDTLFKHADDYFRYFIEKEITMMISTISIAEYCVGGERKRITVEELADSSLQLQARRASRCICTNCVSTQKQTQTFRENDYSKRYKTFCTGRQRKRD
jgi:predicted nucleic acid-binding protein